MVEKGSKRVVGIDASPTHTGLVLFEGSELKLWKYLAVENMGYRFRLADQVVDVLKSWGRIDDIVMENYKYNLKKAQNVYQIGEFMGHIKYKVITEMEVPLLMVFPSRLNKIVKYNKRNKRVRIEWVEREILQGRKIEEVVGKIKGGYVKVYGDLADGMLLAWILVMLYENRIRVDLARWYSKNDLLGNYVDLGL